MIPKDYHDIINLPHHVSKIHSRMSRGDRAAQFAPFAALTGHDAAIQETARLVDEKLELDENQKMEVNNQLNYIKNHLGKKVIVQLIYFQKDKKKEGGTYIELIAQAKKIDKYCQKLYLANDKEILFDDIYRIDNIQVE